MGKKGDEVEKERKKRTGEERKAKERRRGTWNGTKAPADEWNQTKGGEGLD